MKRYFLLYCAVSLLLLVTGCTGSSPRFTSSKTVGGTNGDYSSPEEGMASYYADEFHGRKTSNGEIYDMHDMTAAHRTLPFNSKVEVTNLTNGKIVTVRINDRGPFKDNRIIDLSLAAAKEIDMIGPGTVKVKVRVVELGSTQSLKTQ